MLATRDYFGKYLVEMGQHYPNMVVVNVDLGVATRTLDFKAAYPNRFFECGISEANAVSIAAGLAQEGFRPFVCSFGHFLTGKFLEIFQSVGLNQSQVVLVGTHAGLAIGKDGPTQMGLRDVGLMRMLPNVKILHPTDGIETKWAMHFVMQDKTPCYLRLCRQPQADVFNQATAFEFGKPHEVLKGSEVLIVSQGGTVQPAVVAAQTLSQKGISAGVVAVSSLPLQTIELCRIASGYKKVVIAEDHFEKGGISDEVYRALIPK